MNTYNANENQLYIAELYDKDKIPSDLKLMKTYNSHLIRLVLLQVNHIDSLEIGYVPFVRDVQEFKQIIFSKRRNDQLYLNFSFLDISRYIDIDEVRKFREALFEKSFGIKSLTLDPVSFFVFNEYYNDIEFTSLVEIKIVHQSSLEEENFEMSQRMSKIRSEASRTSPYYYKENPKETDKTYGYNLFIENFRINAPNLINLDIDLDYDNKWDSNLMDNHYINFNQDKYARIQSITSTQKINFTGVQTNKSLRSINVPMKTKNEVFFEALEKDHSYFNYIDDITFAINIRSGFSPERSYRPKYEPCDDVLNQSKINLKKTMIRGFKDHYPRKFENMEEIIFDRLPTAREFKIMSGIMPNLKIIRYNIYDIKDSDFQHVFYKNSSVEKITFDFLTHVDPYLDYSKWPHVNWDLMRKFIKQFINLSSLQFYKFNYTYGRNKEQVLSDSEILSMFHKLNNKKKITFHPNFYYGTDKKWISDFVKSQIEKVEFVFDNSEETKFPKEIVDFLSNPEVEFRGDVYISKANNINFGDYFPPSVRKIYFDKSNENVTIKTEIDRVEVEDGVIFQLSDGSYNIARSRGNHIRISNKNIIDAFPVSEPTIIFYNCEFKTTSFIKKLTHVIFENCLFPKNSVKIDNKRSDFSELESLIFRYDKPLIQPQYVIGDMPRFLHVFELYSSKGFEIIGAAFNWGQSLDSFKIVKSNDFY